MIVYRPNGDGQSTFGWFNTSPTSMESFGHSAHLFSQDTTVLQRFQSPTTLEQRREIIHNYLALLSKSWRFLFPGGTAPRNPWISGIDANNEILHDNPGAMRVSVEDGVVDIRLGSQSPNVLQSLTWRLGNAFEWCMLPDRRRLSGHSVLSRETWDSISIHKNANVLRREPTPEEVGGGEPQVGGEPPAAPVPTSDSSEDP